MTRLEAKICVARCNQSICWRDWQFYRNSEVYREIGDRQTESRLYNKFCFNLFYCRDCNLNSFVLGKLNQMFPKSVRQVHRSRKELKQMNLIPNGKKTIPNGKKNVRVKKTTMKVQLKQLMKMAVMARVTKTMSRKSTMRKQEDVQIIHLG